MSVVKQLINRAMRRELSKLDALYQRHAGQECYIFGDGISLKWMDLHQFSDRLSIAGNMLIYHREAAALKIPYCPTIQPFWFYPLYVAVDDGKRTLFKHIAHQEYRKAIREHPETLFFLNLSNYPAARFANALYVGRWYQPPFPERNPFRDRADSHAGSFNFQLSLAIFLGFTKAYLVGQDYTHYPTRNQHFYEKGEGFFSEHRGFQREFIQYARQHIDLVTVTLDGGCETMPSITYREFTGKEPRFRENGEIVSRERLESIATFHKYWSSIL